MNNAELTLTTADSRTSFEPGETIAINTSWQLPTAPRQAEARLVWYTQGKGDADVGIVQRLPFENPQASDNRSCEFLLPESPYSFSGKLISLTWAVEVILEPGQTKRLDLVVAPGATEVRLTEVQK